MPSRPINSIVVGMKHTNVGIHNEYTLASTVIGTIRYYKTKYNKKSKLYHLIHYYFYSNKGQFDTIFCFT